MNIYRTLLILVFFLFSCSPKTNLTQIDFEEIYNFKSKAIAYSLINGEKTEEFLEFENSSRDAKKKALDKCKKYINSNQTKKLDCKIVFIKITNKIETSLN